MPIGDRKKRQSMAAGEFSRLLVSHWRELHEKLRSQDEEIVIDGRSLSVASVVACARSVYIKCQYQTVSNSADLSTDTVKMLGSARKYWIRYRGILRRSMAT